MKKHAFTLIELLIVVAIIAILAAIAVPNFLEAQTRAKTSRSKSDMRTLVVGLEAYRTDFNKYPVRPLSAMGASWYPVQSSLAPLTTPVAYLTSVGFADPFESGGRTGAGGSTPLTPDYPESYLWAHFGQIFEGSASAATGLTYGARAYYGQPDYDACVVWTFGPSAQRVLAPNIFYLSKTGSAADLEKCVQRLYDPTNGTVSYGLVGRFLGTDSTGILSTYGY